MYTTPVLGWLAWKMGVTPVIPKFYYDAYSQEEIIKELCKELDCLVRYAEYLGENINISIDAINEVKEILAELQNGGWFDLYGERLKVWLNENLEAIIGDAIKMVFFGLTDDGHFVAYIPDSWKEITFDTVINYQNENYGRLVLSYYVNDEALSVTQPSVA